MTGRHSRNKGARVEREAVAILQEAGIAAERIPLSGAAGGSFSGDISMPVMGRDRRLEVKCRAAGFKQIYDWKGGNYGLVLRRDRDAPLIVLSLKDFAELVNRVEWERYRAA